MSTEAMWITVLREAVASSNLSAVAKLIGYAPGSISGVLKGKYGASTKRLQEAVEGGLMGAAVQCPVAGEIPRQRCIEHQRAPFAATNPMRVRLYRACRSGCSHSLIKAGSTK